MFRFSGSGPYEVYDVQQGAKQSTIQGAKKMVIGGLKAFLGASQAGEFMAHDILEDTLSGNPTTMLGKLSI